MAPFWGGGFIIEVQLICSVVPVSAVEHSDSVIHIYTLIFNIFFSIIVCHKDTEYRSLCYTVGPCCLSILYIIVCLC